MDARLGHRMENFAERYRGAAFLALLMGMLVLGVLIILPFLPALLWATVLSILMYPLYRRTTRWFKRRPIFYKAADGWGSALTATITLLIICVPFALIGVGLYSQIGHISRQLATTTSTGEAQGVQSLLQHIDAVLKPVTAPFGTEDLSLAAYARENSGEILQMLRQPVGHAASRILFTGVSLVISLITMFFMLRDGHKLKGPAFELIPLPEERTASILKHIGETVYAVFIGTVLVAMLQGTLLGAGFAVAHVPNAFLFGVIAVFLCTIPLVGATLVYVPAAILMLAEGNVSGAVIIVVVGLLVTKIDYFLRPLLIGGRTNLHPIGIFFGILGGVVLFGPVGLVAGPMVLAVLLALQDVVRERVRNTANDPISRPEPAGTA